MANTNTTKVNRTYTIINAPNTNYILPNSNWNWNYSVPVPLLDRLKYAIMQFMVEWDRGTDFRKMEQLEAEIAVMLQVEPDDHPNRWRWKELLDATPDPNKVQEPPGITIMWNPSTMMASGTVGNPKKPP